MARLYMETETDRVQFHGHCANEYISVRMYWGSAKNPKHLYRIVVEWRKGTEKPTIKVE